MTVSETKLTIPHKKSARLNQISGILAMTGAPMLLIQFLTGGREMSADGAGASTTVALLGVLYIGGWMAGAIAMFRQKVYGGRLSAKIVFVLQMTLLTLALMFSVLESFGVSYENGGLLFAVADAGYPLSHLFMIVVGIFTIRAGKWKNFSKFAPLLVGIALPLTLGLMPVLGEQIGIILFGTLTALGLSVTGYRIYFSSTDNQIKI